MTTHYKYPSEHRADMFTRVVRLNNKTVCPLCGGELRSTKTERKSDISAEIRPVCTKCGAHWKGVKEDPEVELVLVRRGNV